MSSCVESSFVANNTIAKKPSQRNHTFQLRRVKGSYTFTALWIIDHKYTDQINGHYKIKCKILAELFVTSNNYELVLTHTNRGENKNIQTSKDLRLWDTVVFKSFLSASLRLAKEKTRLWIEQSRFEFWLELLCCVVL